MNRWILCTEHEDKEKDYCLLERLTRFTMKKIVSTIITSIMIKIYELAVINSFNGPNPCEV